MYDTLWIGLTLPIDTLRKRIKTRLQERLDSGMLEEVKRLSQKGLSYERMEELGLEYRYLARHLQGNMSYDEMVNELEKEIVRYAKRQMTWFKRNKSIHWFNPKQQEQIMATVKKFLAT